MTPKRLRLAPLAMLAAPQLPLVFLGPYPSEALGRRLLEDCRSAAAGADDRVFFYNAETKAYSLSAPAELVSSSKWRARRPMV